MNGSVKSRPSPRKYSQELKDRAVRMVLALREETGENHGSVKRVAEQLDIGVESVRSWVKRYEIDHGVRPGTTSAEAQRIKELEQEVRELRRANEILKSASAFFGAGARPATSQVVGYIDEYRERFGVEPICRTLAAAGVKIAPSTYYAAKVRPPSARALRDLVMMPILLALWTANYRVYGAHKLWKAARRAGHEIGRDQVARLMRQMGIRGVKKGKRVVTTRRDDEAARPADLVNRKFVASAPNQLWTMDLTYVATWSGVAYVCFITDAFSRMIVGWRVAANMRTEMVLDALEMARWSRGTCLEGLVAHTDAGSQFTSVRYGERLAELGAVPSIGSVGDSYDNALAEAVNGLYKTELIRGPGQGPWKTIEDVELATLAWVHWHNTERLHGYLGDVPPAEFEAAYAAQQADQDLVGIQ